MTSKELSPYSTMKSGGSSSSSGGGGGGGSNSSNCNSSSSGGKSRPARNKSRRSPYPQMTSETNAEFGSEYSLDKTPLEYGTPEVASVPLQPYANIMYSSTPDTVGVDRYSALYSTPYPHPGMAMYRDAACVYSPYQAAATAHVHHRYLDNRSPYRSYEERYYPARDPAAYPGYLSTSAAIQSAAAASTSRLTHLSDLNQDSSQLCLGVQQQFDFRQSGGGSGGNSGNSGGGDCSRSSSRDAPSYTAISYAAPFSNRSESSASEVDVGSEEFTEKRQQQKRQHQKKHKHQKQQSAVAHHTLSHLPESNAIATTTVTTTSGASCCAAGVSTGSSGGTCDITDQNSKNDSFSKVKENSVAEAPQNVSQGESSIPQSVIICRKSNVSSTFTSSEANRKMASSSPGYCNKTANSNNNNNNNSIKSSASSSTTSTASSNSVHFVQNTLSSSAVLPTSSSSTSSTPSSTATVHHHHSQIQQNQPQQQHHLSSSSHLSHHYFQHHQDSQHSHHAQSNNQTSDLRKISMTNSDITPLTSPVYRNMDLSIHGDGSTQNNEKLYEMPNGSGNSNKIYDLASSSNGINDKLFEMSISTGASTNKFYDMSNSSANILFDVASPSSKLYDMSSTNAASKLYEMSTVHHSSKNFYDTSSVASTPSNKFYDMRLMHDRNMAVSGNDYSSCIKAASCNYDNYAQASMYQTATLQAQRSYPVMPQAGYTSVIVDPQQYHVANGYAVH